jgi:hypothetical protein
VRQRGDREEGRESPHTRERSGGRGDRKRDQGDAKKHISIILCHISIYETIIASAAAIARAWNPNVGTSSDADDRRTFSTTGFEMPVDAFMPL